MTEVALLDLYGGQLWVLANDGVLAIYEAFANDGALANLWGFGQRWGVGQGNRTD